MGDNVRLRHFGDCARLVRDTCNPTDVPPLTPYIGLEHIPENDLHLSDYGFAGDVASTKTKFKKEDILFGKLRPYFRKVIIAPFDGVCSTDIWVVRAKKEVDQKYLFYWMASHEFVDQATQGSEGTKMPRAKWEYISRFEQPVPSLPEQHFIAEVLGALDDKIELNRLMNATLESMARAVFKAWFVESEEAKGWKAGTVDEDFSLIMGQSPPGETYNEEKVGIPFFQGRADFGFRFPTNRVYCTAPTRFAKPGDTLVSVRAPVGDINMVAEKCAIGRGVAAIRHKTGSRSYTYYSMHMLKEEFNRFEAEGTVFGSINKADFQALKVKIPPPDKVLGFEEICYPIDQQVENNKKQSYTLASLRDALLPRLMSGEMRVRDSVNQ